VETEDKREKRGEEKKEKKTLPYAFNTNTHHTIKMGSLRHIKRHQGR
jgi:hypothetical protein